MVYDKGTKIIKRIMIVFSVDGAKTTGYSFQKKKSWIPSSHHTQKLTQIGS